MCTQHIKCKLGRTAININKRRGGEGMNNEQDAGAAHPHPLQKLNFPRTFPPKLKPLPLPLPLHSVHTCIWYSMFTWGYKHLAVNTTPLCSEWHLISVRETASSSASSPCQSAVVANTMSSQSALYLLKINWNRNKREIEKVGILCCKVINAICFSSSVA